MASASSWSRSSARERSFINWSSCRCSPGGETPVLAVTIRRPSDLTNWRRTCAPVLLGEQCGILGRCQGGETTMDLGAEGKRAVATGGSRGIGKAIARELAGEGVDVAIVARSKAALAASASQLGGETNRRILPLVADVTSREQV